MEDINLIKKIAWLFHETTGIEFEELFAEAALAYCEGLKNGKHPYNPTKGSMSTHMWYRITNHLKDYLKKQPAYKYAYHNKDLVDPTKTPHLEYVDIQYTERPITQIPFWEALNKEAQEIANIVLFKPKTYLKYNRQSDAVERVKQVLKDKGWSNKKIEYGITNLKLAFS